MFSLGLPAVSAEYPLIGGTATVESLISRLEYVVTFLNELERVELSLKSLRHVCLHWNTWQPREANSMEQSESMSLDQAVVESVDHMAVWFKGWTGQMDQELCIYLSTRALEIGVSVFSLRPWHVLQPIHRHLISVPLHHIRARAALLLHLNTVIVPLLPTLETRTLMHESSTPFNVIQKHRFRLFTELKSSILRQLVHKTTNRSKYQGCDQVANNSGLPVINLHIPRREPSRLMTKKNKDDTFSLIRQVIDQFMQLAPPDLRRASISEADTASIDMSPTYQVETIAFVVNHSGGGGERKHSQTRLYASIFYVLGHEMASTILSVFGKCGERSNTAQVVTHGHAAEMSNIDELLRTCHVFGQWMGISIRSKVGLPLFGLDDQFWEELAYGLLFPAVDVDCVERAAYTAMVQGLGSIVPTPILPLLTPLELKELVCGNSHSYVHILKDHAVYTGGSSLHHPVVQVSHTAIEDMKH